MPERIVVLPPSQPRKSRAGCWVSMGVGLLLFLVILILGAPWLRADAKRHACRNQLRAIGIAMHLYADDSDNAFMEHLQQLFSCNYTDNTKIFSCPGMPSQHEDFWSGAASERSSSYTYIPGLTSSMPGTFILAYDKSPENHHNGWLSGGRNVLCVDAGVTFWPASREAEFQRRLALQKEAIAKWHTAGKPAMAIGEFISPELWEMMGR